MIDLTTTTDDGSHTIALVGQLDHRSAPRLRAALTGLRLAAGHRLVLDLAGLTFCDSSGLVEFVVAHQLASAAGAEAALAAPPVFVSKMLGITGLAAVITTTPERPVRRGAWR